MQQNITNLITFFQQSWNNNTFVKMSLTNYKGKEPNLKKIYLKKAIIKKQEVLSFTYRYTTNDITKNYTFPETTTIITGLLNDDNFRSATLFTTAFDITLEYINPQNWKLKQNQPTTITVPLAQHDKQKNRKIEAKGKHYLHQLKITDADGNVLNAAQDKYKQINHYIEILSSLLNELPQRTTTNVVDMGAGKGYLTFALYDYLNNVIHKPATVTGVESRKELVELCNTIAQNSAFNNLHFQQGSIDKYQTNNLNVLIALHACDTATDDAIAKGILGNADLIVVAPCCHKQIRREIEKHKVKNNLTFLTKHGIFLEHQAEMVTDGIRALVLEYYGYSTKVFEFVSDAHTPKNVLIVGIKKQNTTVHKQDILSKIDAAKKYFGIGEHHLEKMMGLFVNKNH